MKKLSLTLLTLTVASFSMAAAVPPKTEFANMIKSQKQAIESSCVEGNRKHLPTNAGAKIKSLIKKTCACQANELTSSTTISKLYAAAKGAKNQQQYTDKVGEIGAALGAACQKKIFAQAGLVPRRK